MTGVCVLTDCFARTRLRRNGRSTCPAHATGKGSYGRCSCYKPGFTGKHSRAQRWCPPVRKSDAGRVRVLIVVNADWFFLSHRLPLALGAKRAGAEVIVVTGDTGRSADVRAAGFEFVALPITR